MRRTYIEQKQREVRRTFPLTVIPPIRRGPSDVTECLAERDGARGAHSYRESDRLLSFPNAFIGNLGLPKEDSRRVESSTHLKRVGMTATLFELIIVF